MQYFVSIENTRYYQWQIELLIESFKNCNDKLFIAVADKTNLKINHKNIFRHKNIGELRGFPDLNSLYSTFWALENNFIAQPFTFIPAHVVLRKEPTVNLTEYPQVITSGKVPQKTFITIGNVMIFNKVPHGIFKETIRIAEELAVKQILENGKIDKKLINLAWSTNLGNLTKDITIIKDESLTDDMLGNTDSSFIDYEHGMPPVFHKSMFNSEYLTIGNPLEILSNNFPTKNSYYIAQLAKNINVQKINSRS